MKIKELRTEVELLYIKFGSPPPDNNVKKTKGHNKASPSVLKISKMLII